MNKTNKREHIMDAMQELMHTEGAENISVSDIAKKAGIGKGSIYYYFSSKNEIIEAVIERSYSRVLDAGRELAASKTLNAFEKMEIIYKTCLDSSVELRRQEDMYTFNELQRNALIHEKYERIIITKLRPILTEIIRQGIAEGRLACEFPEEMAHIVLLVLTLTIGNHLIPLEPLQMQNVLLAFVKLQEKGMDIPAHTLSFLTSIVK